MKSLNIKIPVDLAVDMDNRAQLNPDFITGFLITYLNCATHENLKDVHYKTLTYTYTFKIDSDVHKAVKLKAIELDMPMNEMVARLLIKYY